MHTLFHSILKILSLLELLLDLIEQIINLRIGEIKCPDERKPMFIRVNLKLLVKLLNKFFFWCLLVMQRTFFYVSKRELLLLCCREHFTYGLLKTSLIKPFRILVVVTKDFTYHVDVKDLFVKHPLQNLLFFSQVYFNLLRCKPCVQRNLFIDTDRIINFLESICPWLPTVQII